jgi:hypothetical protein
MGDAIRRLADFVSRVAQTATNGGNCLVVDETRCVLYDCGRWTSDMHDAVARRFPGCAATVSPLDSSVSGFVVVFDLQPHHSGMATAFAVLLAVGSLCVVTLRVYEGAGLPFAGA